MKRIPLAAGVVLAASFLSLPAFGATNYWDNNGAAAGFGTAGGTWGVEQKWSSAQTGALTPETTATTAGDDLWFGSGTNGLAAGAITVDGTNQAFRSLTFAPSSGAIALSGGTLNLGAPATRVTVNNASNTIASILAGTNSLHKFGASTYASFLSSTATTVFSNTTLSEYIGADGMLGGFSILGGTTPADAYFFVNNGTNATYQLQAFNGGYTKCVKVELVQVGPNVTARVLYAKYLNQVNVNQLGYNFDEGGTDNSIATSVGTAGYGAEQTTLSTLATYRQYLTSTASTIFTNTTLASCVGADGVMGGAWVAGGPVAADAYHFANDGTTATYQLQALNDVYTKCVKVELTQAGPNVAARAVYAKYVSGSQLGYNFDAGGNEGSIATGAAVGGYGAAETTLMTASENTTLLLTGNNTYSGATLIGNGALALEGQGRLGGGAYAGAILNSGQLVVKSSSDQLFSGAISSSGSLVKGYTNALPAVAYSNFLGTSASVIFSNTSLAAVRGVTGWLGGLNIDRQPQPAYGFHFTNDGATATVQLRLYDGTYTKCVKVELTQNGADLAARVLYARYLSGNQIGQNFDSVVNSFSIATSAASSGYGVARLTLLPYPVSRLALSGSNTYAGGTTINSGLLEALSSANALPSSGGITVNGPAELRLSAGELSYNNAGGVGNGNPITVNSGATLSVAGYFNAGYSRAVTLNGGTLSILAGSVDDASNYMCNLSLLNGAQVVGNKPRTGYFMPGSVTVGGTSPSTLATGLLLVNGGYPLYLNVSNVTGNAAADLVVSGLVKDLSGLAGMPIVKTGAGTVAFSATNTAVARLTVVAGTVALGVNSAFDGDNNVTLSGGALEMGGYTNTLGTLTVVSNSVIALAAGKLGFADSSAAAWTNLLSLTGTLDNQTLRFGTNGTALTSQQVASISLNGKRVRLRSDGYLSPFVWGTAISLR